jgi:hypothetical protein
MGDRKYSSRHFRKEEDGTFSVWYANREHMDKVIAEEVQDANVWLKHRKLVLIHPDNSVEFLRNSYDQGDNMYLTEALGWHSHNVKAKGGGEGKLLLHPLRPTGAQGSRWHLCGL